MDLRTRPMWSVRAMRWLMKQPAPIAYVEAPLERATATIGGVQAPASKGARVILPTPPRGTPQAAVPTAPVRVAAKVTAATSSTPLAPTTTSSAFGPGRTPTAPVKNGRAYDWTGLP